MISVKDIFKKHPFLFSAFLLASALTLFFAFRFISSAVYWSQHHEEPIRPWMTIGYIGKSWDLNPRAIDETASLPLPVAGKPYTLQDIADQRGVPVENIIKQVEAAITELKVDGSD